VNVSEVFKVMAQVDHDLTIVGKFDRQLGLIKNLGRHSLPPLNGISSRDSILKNKVGRKKLMVSSLQKTRVLGVEIILRLPSCIFFRMMAPLYLVHLYDVPSGLPLLLV
jgi:hypothetical protein